MNSNTTKLIFRISKLWKVLALFISFLIVILGNTVLLISRRTVWSRKIRLKWGWLRYRSLWRKYRIGRIWRISRNKCWMKLMISFSLWSRRITSILRWWIARWKSRCLCWIIRFRLSSRKTSSIIWLIIIFKILRVWLRIVRILARAVYRMISSLGLSLKR